MDTKTFKYGDNEYQYYIVYQDRKTVRLTVYPNLKIVLYCRIGYSKDKIEKFLKRKALWLKSQVQDLKRLQRSNKKKEYVSGESFLYLGRQYKLIVEEGDEDYVRFKSGRIMLYTTDKSRNQNILDDWYLNRAKKVFRDRYRVMLKKFNYEFVPDLALRKMPKRWGSFLTKKKVLLNPELIKASKECIDYVIIHELCHMKHQNHSPEYYRFLSSKCPNWKGVKEQLELRFSSY